MIIARPRSRFAFSHPAHFIALGFGAGLSPFAPGTAGTLVAIPLWWLLRDLGDPLLIVGVIAALYALGVWACGVTGRHLGVSDHGAMCWDEVVAFLLVLAGRRVLPVPRLRRGEAAADPRAGDALQGRLRRDVRRHPRRGVHAAGARDRPEAVLLISRLARRLGRKLAAGKRMLATAESCTGGWVAEAVTSVAGSSGWFERGYVTYSNAAKRENLGVSRRTLLRHGAVSEQTAREMARGALKKSRADIAVSITGIAGPGGAVPGKPVGTVCFAWAQGRKMRSETKRFKGGRGRVRRLSILHALNGVLKWL
jgi:nicotinamide-nucleotide amidase